MVERHLATQNLSEDKNAPFRQQASIIAKKKENKAEQLSDLKSVLANVEEELEEKQNKLKELAGDTILRGEEFKKYVNKLKGRTIIYKQNRAELSALKFESGILARTLEVLSSRDDNVLKALVNFISVYSCCSFSVIAFNVCLMRNFILATGRSPTWSVRVSRDRRQFGKDCRRNHRFRHH